ncbi:MAG TPA: hypothetical protein VJ698_03145 [Noviherbaspirillum sp.]|nr:hypothetical protein [Noviherbaspirillum sp.]
MAQIGGVIAFIGLLALIMDSPPAGVLSTGTGSRLIVVAVIGVWLHQECD